MAICAQERAEEKQRNQNATVLDMRKNFMKEIQLLRQLLDIRDNIYKSKKTHEQVTEEMKKLRPLL